jgi:hypothetical protein
MKHHRDKWDWFCFLMPFVAAFVISVVVLYGLLMM